MTQFAVGQVCRETLLVDSELIRKFASFSGDCNPIHVDTAAARTHGFPRPVAHGAILVAMLSRLIGTRFPGPGALWMRQTIEWKAPVFEGDTVDVTLTVTAHSDAVGVLEFDVSACNQRGQVVMSGGGAVRCPVVAERKEGPEQPTRRVALVTGGSRGIGATIAQRLAEAGWAVVVNYWKSASHVEALVSDVRNTGGEATAFQGDMSDDGAVRALVGHAVSSYGRLDAVVHCATPPLKRVDLANLSYADVEPFLRTYLGGAISLVSAARSYMEQQHYGRIVLLGTAALFGTPPSGWCGYVSAKASLLGFLHSAAAELGPYGITVNVVSPGLTVTDLTGDISARAKEIEARRIPVRRLATGEDTAALVTFLLSEGASYMSGAHIPVTGGLG